jgi:hypothetical protein
MSWSIDSAQARMGSEVGCGVLINVGAAIVHNQMKAVGVAIGAGDLTDTPQEVLMVVFVDTPAPHGAIIDVESNH